MVQCQRKNPDTKAALAIQARVFGAGAGIMLLIGAGSEGEEDWKKKVREKGMVKKGMKTR